MHANKRVSRLVAEAAAVAAVSLSIAVVAPLGCSSEAPAEKAPGAAELPLDGPGPTILQDAHCYLTAKDESTVTFKKWRDDDNACEATPACKFDPHPEPTTVPWLCSQDDFKAACSQYRDAGSWVWSKSCDEMRKLYPTGKGYCDAFAAMQTDQDELTPYRRTVACAAVLPLKSPPWATCEAPSKPGEPKLATMCMGADPAVDRQLTTTQLVGTANAGEQLCVATRSCTDFRIVERPAPEGCTLAVAPYGPCLGRAVDFYFKDGNVKKGVTTASATVAKYQYTQEQGDVVDWIVAKQKQCTALAAQANVTAATFQACKAARDAYLVAKPDQTYMQCCEGGAKGTGAGGAGGTSGAGGSGVGGDGVGGAGVGGGGVGGAESDGLGGAPASFSAL